MAVSHPGSSEPPDNGQWVEKAIREVSGQRYRRFVVRTHLIQPGEQLERTLLPYLEGKVGSRDIIVLGEKIVAIAEGRAILLTSVKARPIARFLSRHVRQLGYGLGLRRPETMEMAIREAGLGRVLLAAAAGALDRVVGRSGDFYRIAGRRVASIDGPGPTTIAPYNQYIVLAPANPQRVVQQLAKHLKAGVAVVDVNDIGSEVLATSDGIDPKLVAELLRDNPMGQGAQRTPVAVLRPAQEVKPKAPWPRTRAGWADGGGVVPMPGSGDGSLIWADDEVASTEKVPTRRQ